MLHILYIEDRTLHQQKDYGSLYCGGLELNPQYLQGMLVLTYLLLITTLWGDAVIFII